MHIAKEIRYDMCLPALYVQQAPFIVHPPTIVYRPPSLPFLTQVARLRPRQDPLSRDPRPPAIQL